ncbi:hypothetical protein RJ640_028449 [Escallonia rubra]|uniref:Transposase Tnp1/En/Spm-like domain-containing protein n=1 Tax=Escallonia rubra TaxID=112253 RepID=A0AA88QJH1_9ASTE|nr:hypothetical protein RJ640_028449 [Escallonia rubra]
MLVNEEFVGDDGEEMVSRARSSGENMIEQSNVQIDPLQFDGINSGQSNPATAMANYLGFDVYDLELTAVRSDSDLWRLLIRPANRIAVIGIMHEKKEKLSEGSQDLPAENDILSQVVGKDKYGRGRMYGLGVSQSDVWGQIPSRKQSQRIAMEWKENCEHMEERFNNRIDELKSMFLRHRGHEESQSDACSPATSINHRPQMTSTQLSRPFRVRDVVCLKSIMNPSETVAKGIIQSIDPSTEVGGEELGPNWCEVSIQVAVKKDERLIRSYGFHKTIYDAYGATVAWPCPYQQQQQQHQHQHRFFILDLFFFFFFFRFILDLFFFFFFFRFILDLFFFFFFFFFFRFILNLFFFFFFRFILDLFFFIFIFPAVIVTDSTAILKPLKDGVFLRFLHCEDDAMDRWKFPSFGNNFARRVEGDVIINLDENEFPTSEAKEIEETKAEQEFKAFKASENDKLTNGEEPVEKIEESENTDGDDNAQYEEMEDESIDKDVRVHGGQNVNNSGMTFDVSLREENVVGSFPLYSLSNFEEESNDYFLMAKNDVIVPQEYAAKVDVLKTYFIENHPRELFFMTRKDNDFVESRTSYYPQLGVENLLSDTGWVNMEIFFDLKELLEMSRENGQDPICTQVTKKCQRCNKKMCHMQYTSKEMAKKIVAFDGIGDWVAIELRRREPYNLASAMAIIERLEDFKEGERTRSPRHECAKDRENGRSKSGSPKATDDEWSEDEGRRRHHKGKKKHEGSRKQGDSCDHKAHRGLEEDASTVQDCIMEEITRTKAR